MKYQKLSKTDIKVSRVCIGLGNISAQAEPDVIETINAALDIGINFFDSSELYGNGHAEEILGKALSSIRQDVVIATKVAPSNLSYERLMKSCKNSLRRLKTDYVDLYYIHWPNWNISINETLRAMEELKKLGKIRAMGVSNFGVRDLKQALDYTPDIEVDQLAYNLLFRAIEYEILPFCIENNVEVVCHSSLLQGLLADRFSSPEEVPVLAGVGALSRHFSSKRPKTLHHEEGAEEETFEALDEIRKISQEMSVPMAELSLAWLLAQKGVISTVVGAASAEEVRQCAHAADLETPRETYIGLNKVTESLKGKLGKNPDMWVSESRIR
jgi:aryl-alcohol dehydrogenase-like predicted oxidoreductase